MQELNCFDPLRSSQRMSFIDATEVPARVLLSPESVLLKVLYFGCDLTLRL